MEPAARYATVDRAAADAEADELRVRHDAVLARCEARQPTSGCGLSSTLVCGVLDSPHPSKRRSEGFRPPAWRS